MEKSQNSSAVFRIKLLQAAVHMQVTNPSLLFDAFIVSDTKKLTIYYKIFTITEQQLAFQNFETGTILLA